MQKLLDGNLGKVSVTTDLWTASNKKRGYMAFTGHLNDNNWKMRNTLLRFMYIPTPHTGDRLAERLYDCLLDWNIDAKLSSITLDNCSNNDSMITELKDKMGVSDLLLDDSLLHMRCAAHILNLIVSDRLDVIKDVINLIKKNSEAVVENMEGLFSAMSFEDSSMENPTNGGAAMLFIKSPFPSMINSDSKPSTGIWLL
ncbi:Putative AC9 transposase [Linum grandiflorum]